MEEFEKNGKKFVRGDGLKDNINPATYFNLHIMSRYSKKYSENYDKIIWKSKKGKENG